MSIPIRSLAVLVLIVTRAAWAGAPAPQATEKELVDRIAALKATKAAVMPGDNFPRTLRLAEALRAMGEFYEQGKRFKEADQAYADALAILTADKSPQALDLLRYTEDAIGRALTGRGEFALAKPHLDAAVTICRNDPRERQVLPTVLMTLAQWHTQQKQWKEAETALLEAIGLRGQFAYNEQVALIDVYLSAGRNDDASALISTAEKSKFASASVVFRRARLLRATGKPAEADALEEKARAQEKAEAASRAARQ